jgi:hypothetical protein
VLELVEVVLVEAGLEFGWFCCQKMKAKTASNAKTTSKPRFCSIRDMASFYVFVREARLDSLPEMAFDVLG